MSSDPSHPWAQEPGSPADLPRPSAWAVLLVVAIFLALLAALFFVGYVSRAKEAAVTKADSEQRANAVPSVGVAVPRETVGAKDVVLPADIHPNQETALYPRTSGYLKKLYVDINDRVQAGQLLAEIDTPEVDAQLVQSKAALAQARANLVKAQADVTLAGKTLDRYKELPAGAASAQDVDQRQGAYDDAVAALEQSKAAVGVADADVQRLSVLQGFEKVTAPFAGVITARNYDLGALLSATNSSGREMFHITQSDTLRVDVNLPQVYASEVTLGEVACLTVRNYPDKQFQGVVARSSSSLNPASRTMLFELTFNNAQGLLYPGMYGQVRLLLSRQNPILVIPGSALLFNSSGTQVATVVDNKVHFQSIQVGRDLGTEIEVLGGLAKDAQVIANPAAQLAEGMPVQPVPQKLAEEPKPAAVPRASR